MMDRKIAKIIRILRVKHDYTQKDLAMRAHISQRAISALEDAKSLTVDNLTACATAFGLKLSELIQQAEALDLADDGSAA